MLVYTWVLFDLLKLTSVMFWHAQEEEEKKSVITMFTWSVPVAWTKMKAYGTDRQTPVGVDCWAPVGTKKVLALRDIL